ATMDLKGKPEFDPDTMLAAAIEVIGRTRVNVTFGSFAHGELVVERDDDGYQAGTTILDMDHPHLQSRDSDTRLGIVLHIKNSKILGYIAPYPPGANRPGAHLKLYEAGLNPILFGRAYYAREDLKLTGWTNQVKDGQLKLVTGFHLTPLDGPPIYGALA